jgi:two-component system response regulator NreC
LTPIRILIADSRPDPRSVLTTLVSGHFEWEVCGEASDGDEAIEKARQLRPDIVVLDIDLPQLGGLEAARRIANSCPRQKSIVLATSDEPEVMRRIFDAGAHGFLLKANAARDLVAAIEKVSSGRTFYSAQAAGLVLQDCLNSSVGEEALNGRQREILKLLTKEFSSTFSPSHNRRVRRRPRFKAVASAALLALAVLYILGVTFFDLSLVSLFQKAPSPQASGGNPEVTVWIDLRTALYYCPGEPQYTQHHHGRFAKQIDAQRDHFEPASRKACN